MMFITDFFFQDIRKSQDRVHRRPNFMAHIGQEFTFNTIGAFSSIFGINQRIFSLNDKQGEEPGKNGCKNEA